MKKIIAFVMVMALFTAFDAMAAQPSPGASSGGSSSSEDGTTTTGGVVTKYSVSAAEAAATDGDTNTVSWTFE